MNPTEAFAFFKKQAALFEGGLGKAFQAKNKELVVFNTRHVFKAQAMQGLILWRMEQDPVACFGKAVEVILSAVDFCESTNFPKSSLPLERAGFLSFLIGRPGCPDEISGLHDDRLLDALLAKALFEKEMRPNLFDGEPTLLRALPSDLARKTYGLYADLLAGKLSAGDGARKGAILFEARKSDDFYTGGDQIEGGGGDNKFVVDFRLGAILKKLGSDVPSIHAWRWA